MISKQIFSLNFMFLCSLIENLCRKEESDKTGCNFNFGHECTTTDFDYQQQINAISKNYFSFKKISHSKADIVPLNGPQENFFKIN